MRIPSQTTLLSAVFILMILSSCKIDSDKKVNRDKFKFKVRADASLFFRNVRQIYYDRFSPDGKWQAYRFGNRPREGTFVNPVIVINWLKDEAYLLIESSEDLNEEDLLSLIIKNPTSKGDTIILKDRGRERMLEFGSRIYEAIQHQDSIQVKIKGVYTSILKTEDDRENFRIPMSDYFRLTKIF